MDNDRRVPQFKQGLQFVLVRKIVHSGTIKLSPIEWFERIIGGDAMGWKKTACTIISSLVVVTTLLSTSADASTFTQKNIDLNGSILSRPDAIVASDGSNETTFMPIWYIGKALTAAGFTQSWNGQTRTWSLSTSGTTNFSNLQVGSGSAAISVNGVIVKRARMYVEKDPVAGWNGQATVYLPIYYIQQILNDAGISSTWNGQTWSMTTNSATTSISTSPIILGFVTDYGNDTNSLEDYEQNPELNQMNTFTGLISGNGSVSGNLFAQAEVYAKGMNQPAYLTVADINAQTGNIDGNLVNQVLSNTSYTDNLIQNLVNLVKNTSFTGINIDFEQFAISDRSAFSEFLLNLSAKLHAVGKKLSVDVPAVTNAESAYDYGTIGAVSDEVIVMAYDYSYPGTPAGPIAPIGWVSQVLSYATSQIPASKLLLGIPAYGYDWSKGQAQALSLTQIDSIISTYNITPNWDATDEVPYFNYTENGVNNTVYYENAQSTGDELTLVQEYHLAGIAIWRIGLEDSSFWSAIQQLLK